MNEKTILIIGALVIFAILIILLKVCTNFRNKVYQLFVLAEKEANSGQKMDYVVEKMYLYIPYPVSLFVNEKVLRWLLQKMFEVIKDFLNDGSINKK